MLSVILPVHNHEEVLSVTLGSLIKACSEEAEIIVVDDGSTDDSALIVNKYCLTNTNIKLITQEHQGLSAARNTGLNRAFGEYVLFMRPGDYLIEKVLEEKWSDRLSEKDSDMIIFSSVKVSPSGDRYVLNELDQEAVEIRSTRKLEKLVNCPLGSCLFRRKFLTDEKIVFSEVKETNGESKGSINSSTENGNVLPEGAFREAWNERRFLLKALAGAEKIKTFETALYVDYAAVRTGGRIGHLGCSGEEILQVAGDLKELTEWIAERQELQNRGTCLDYIRQKMCALVLEGAKAYVKEGRNKEELLHILEMAGGYDFLKKYVSAPNIPEEMWEDMTLFRENPGRFVRAARREGVKEALKRGFLKFPLCRRYQEKKCYPLWFM